MESAIHKLVSRTLLEDNWQDDVTSRSLFSKNNPEITAFIFSKQPGIFSGEKIINAFSGQIDNISFSIKVAEGSPLEKNQKIVELSGNLSEILSVERSLLNLLSRSCGIATITRDYVNKLGSKIKLLPTRKTTPGLRELELTAVVAGGGRIHRRSLSDGILIKENHLQYCSVEEALELAHATKSPLHKIEIEVQSLEILDRVLASEAKPDIIMLDNFNLETLKTALSKIKGKFEVEVSGGVTLDRISELSNLEIDYVSVGRITHSAPILDLSLDIV